GSIDISGLSFDVEDVQNARSADKPKTAQPVQPSYATSSNEEVEFSGDESFDSAPASKDLVSMGSRGVEEAKKEDVLSKARIGDRLVSMGIITKDQLNVALQEKKIS